MRNIVTKSISTIHATVVNFLIFILLILTVVVYNLHHGISLEKLHLFNVKVEKLYIKWDKKLLLTVQSLNVATTKTESQHVTLLDLKDILGAIGTFFDTIQIQSLQIANETIAISYINQQFHFENKHYFLDTSIDTISKDRVNTTIHRFDIKKYDLSLFGHLHYNNQNQQSDFTGKFDLDTIEGTLNASLQKENVNFFLKTQAFSSLQPILKHLKLPKNIQKWAVTKRKNRSIQVHSMSGMFHLKRPEQLHKTLHAKLSVHDLHYTFDTSLPAAFVEKANLTFKNKLLTITTDHAQYEQESVKDVSVTIYTGAKPTVNVTFDHTGQLNPSIQTVLQNYNVHVPLMQHSGITTSSSKIFVELANNEKTTYEGSMVVKDANITLGRLPLYVKHATLHIDNNLSIKHAHIMYDTMFDSNLSGNINLQTNHGHLDFDIHKLKSHVRSQTFIDIQNRPFSFDIVINDHNIQAREKSVALYLDIGEKTTLEIDDIATLYEYSPFLQYRNITHGDLRLSTKDFYKFTINGSYRPDVIHFFDKEDHPIDTYKLAGQFTTTNLSLSINNKVHLFKSDNTHIIFNDYDLFLPAINSEDDDVAIEKYTLSSVNSNLIFDNKHKLLTSTLNATFKGDDATIHATHKDGDLSILMDKHGFILEAYDFSDSVVKSLLGFTFFRGGNYNLYMDGKSENDFQAYMTLSDLLLTDLGAYNNMLALINTLPGLLTLTNPGFNSNGYKIRSGYLQFKYKKPEIIFEMIHLEGDSTDIVGEGHVNLEHNTIDLKLSVQTLKGLSNVISAIPIAGYLVLGEDGKFSTKMDVKGNLDDPEVTTHTLKGIISAPINIIKRVLTSPKKLVDMLNSGEETNTSTP